MKNIFDREVISNSESTEINDLISQYNSHHFEQQNDFLNQLVGSYYSNKQSDIKEQNLDFYVKSKDSLNVSINKVLQPSRNKEEISAGLIFEWKFENSVKENIVANTNIGLRPWKNIENISARLVSFNENEVILECLVDKEKEIYEERSFRSSLFQEMNLFLGKLFYLRLFERICEIKIQIHEDPTLVLENDFPKIKLADKFKNSRLFNK